MGLFLQTILFPEGDNPKCQTFFKICTEDSQMWIQPDECRWHLFDKGPAVLLNDGCYGGKVVAERMSSLLESPVMMLSIYNGEFWSYCLWEKKEEIDSFSSLAGYSEVKKSFHKPGNAKIIKRCFGVSEEQVERYLIPWDEEEIGVSAYDTDKSVVGDCWQMVDFMKALGFDFDLLCPPKERFNRTLSTTCTTPSYQTATPNQSSQIPDTPILPNALTDRFYALCQAVESEHICPKITELFAQEKYQEIVSVLTDAVKTSPDNHSLYLLRAFCWNQMEGKACGLSRKPDMDRDLTKVLELDPDNIMALRGRCPTAATTHRCKRHIQDLTRLIELDSDNISLYQLDRAYRWHWTGDDENARKDLEAILDRGNLWTVDLTYLCQELNVRGMG